MNKQLLRALVIIIFTSVNNNLCTYIGYMSCSGPADISGNGACAQAAVTAGQGATPAGWQTAIQYGWTGEFCENVPAALVQSVGFMGLLCTAGFHSACSDLPGVDILGPWYDYNSMWDDGSGYCHVPYVIEIGKYSQWCRSALTKADGTNPDCTTPDQYGSVVICNEASKTCQYPIQKDGGGYCGRDSDCGCDFRSKAQLFCNTGVCVSTNPVLSCGDTTPAKNTTVPVKNPPILLAVEVAKYSGK